MANKFIEIKDEGDKFDKRITTTMKEYCEFKAGTGNFYLNFRKLELQDETDILLDVVAFCAEQSSYDLETGSILFRLNDVDDFKFDKLIKQGQGEFSESVCCLIDQDFLKKICDANTVDIKFYGSQRSKAIEANGLIRYAQRFYNGAFDENEYNNEENNEENNKVTDKTKDSSSTIALFIYLSIIILIITILLFVSDAFAYKSDYNNEYEIEAIDSTAVVEEESSEVESLEGEWFQSHSAPFHIILEKNMYFKYYEVDGDYLKEGTYTLKDDVLVVTFDDGGTMNGHIRNRYGEIYLDFGEDAWFVPCD